MNFGALRDVLLAASVIPMALLGGIFALLLTGTPFSVSSAIGFVALFGIAAMDGIHGGFLLQPQPRVRAGSRERDAADLPHAAAARDDDLHRRLRRPDTGGLSTGIGSQVQRPLALVVVGGMLLAPVLILLVLPRADPAVLAAQAMPDETARRATRMKRAEALAAGLGARRRGRRGVRLRGTRFSPTRGAARRRAIRRSRCRRDGIGGTRRRGAALSRAAGSPEELVDAVRLDKARRSGAGGAAREPLGALRAGRLAPGDGEHRGAARQLISGGAGELRRAAQEERGRGAVPYA